MSFGRILLFLALVFVALPGIAAAFEVQEVTSPKGITAWLVESHGIPIVSMNFSFEGGSSLDAAGKEGSAHLMTSMLTEGAGALSSAAFKSEVTRLNMGLSFSVDADYAEGGFSCLSESCDQALDLLKLALAQPRFETDAFARVQQLAVQSIQHDSRDQGTVALRAWHAKAFPGHAYGRPVMGTAKTVAGIGLEDLRRIHAATMKRSGLRIAVVGDIDAKTLASKLDAVFGDLPLGQATEKPAPVALAKGPVLETMDFEGPQTFIVFGNASLNIGNNEAMATHLTAELLGGGANFARLNQSLREKSGLTYGVFFSDLAPRQANYMLGSFSTANETALQALQTLRAELALMAKDGPSEDELRRVKSYVNGSYPLRFTSNASIAQTLLAAQQLGRGTDFVERRTQRVNAVTVADIKAAAATLLKPENQIVVMVGRPKK